ncbi:MAG TPA: hypothetical protein VK870_10300 [Ignavibacteriaceae bacterium]|nr:hypothetical protein [Ignavibacteriaceae bacterium]
MGIFSSKRLRELEIENEDLKNRIHVITEREESIRHLNDVLRKMRSEVSELNELKLTLSSEINYLKEEELQKKDILENLNHEISQLRELKLEEQNNLLVYSEQIKSLEKIIREKKVVTAQEINLIFQPSDDELSETSANKNMLLNEIEGLEAKLETLKDHYGEIQTNIDNLSYREEQLERLIDDKKAEADNIEKVRLIRAIDELRRVEEKSNQLITEQKSLIDKINFKQKSLEEITKKVSQLSEEEAKSRKKLNWLQQEIDTKKNEIGSIQKHISELSDKESDIKNKIDELVRDKDELSKLDKQQAGLKEQEKEFRVTLDFLHKEIEQKKSESDNLQNHISNLLTSESELKQKVIELENIQEKLISSVKRYEELKSGEDNLTNRLVELEQELSHKSTESEVIVKNLERLKFDEEETRKRIENLRIIEDELLHDIKENHDITEKHSEYQQQLEELENNISLKQSEVDEITAKLNLLKETEKTASQKAEEIKSLNKEIEKQQQIQSNLQSEEKGYKQRIEQLKQEASEKTRDAEAIKIAVDELREIERALHTRVSDYEQIKLNIASFNKRLTDLRITEKELIGKMDQLNDEIEQKNSELDKLKNEYSEISKLSSDSQLKVQEYDEICVKVTEAEKRLEELKLEEDSLTKTLSELENLMSEKRSEVNSISNKIDSLINEEKIIADRIEGLKNIEKILLLDIDKNKTLIDNQNEQKEQLEALNNDLELKTRQVADISQKLLILRTEEETLIKRFQELDAVQLEIENLVKSKSEIQAEEQQNRIKLEELISEVEYKLQEIERINNSIAELRSIEAGLKSRIDEYENAKSEVTELTRKLFSLKEEEHLSTQKIEELKTEVSEHLKTAETVKIDLSQLKDAEENTRRRIDILANEAKEKIDALAEAERSLRSREVETTELENQLAIKLKEINDANLRHQKVFEQIELRQKELIAVEENLDIKSKKLSRLANEVSELEQKHLLVQEDTKQLEVLKEQLHKKIILEQENYAKLQKETQQVRDLVPLLEERKEEIERTNFELENRFTRMFQKFNSDMNEINKKKVVLEQIINKKDLELEEKDQLLFEKISALEESERILSMRQAEIDSFEDLLRVIEEKKEQLKNDLLKLDTQAIERKNYNNDLKAESDLILRKKVLIEQGLEEMLGTMNSKYVDTRERRYKIDKDIKEHEDRLNEINHKVSDAMTELVELQNSISAIKIEHEDHRGQIIKLASMKKKLHDEIAKNQRALQRYQKIREKIKLEQTLSKGRIENPDLKIELDQFKDLESKEGQDNSKIFKI